MKHNELKFYTALTSAEYYTDRTENKTLNARCASWLFVNVQYTCARTPRAHRLSGLRFECQMKEVTSFRDFRVVRGNQLLLINFDTFNFFLASEPTELKRNPEMFPVRLQHSKVTCVNDPIHSFVHYSPCRSVVLTT